MRENRQNADKIIIRVPDGMRPALKARAASNHRSTNMEIVQILELALSGEAATTGEGLGNSHPVAAGNRPGVTSAEPSSTRY